MSKTILTTAAVAEAIDQLVIERGPDYIYPSAEQNGCFYTFEDGAPGCIVGAVVAKLDPVGFEWLKNSEPTYDDGNGLIRRDPVGSALGIFGIGDEAAAVEAAVGGFRPPHSVDSPLAVESEPLLRALRRAQSAQDTGSTWEDARREFITTLHLSELSFA